MEFAQSEQHTESAQNIKQERRKPKRDEKTNFIGSNID